jgi:hypothetical protein
MSDFAFGPQWNRTGVSLLNALQNLADGEMNTGVTVNDKFLAGSKSLIASDETMHVPEEYEHNSVNLIVDGIIDLEGDLNIID